MKMKGTPKGTTITGSTLSAILSGAGSTLTERILFYTGMVHRTEPNPVREHPVEPPDPEETQKYIPPLPVAGWFSTGEQADGMNTLNTGSSHGLLFVPQS